MPAEFDLVECVEALDIALHGYSWARPKSTRFVWESLLDEVRTLVAKSDELDARYPPRYCPPPGAYC